MADAPAYMPGKQNDVFVSYAHVDNAPITLNPGAEPFRWVSHFNENLQAFLTQHLGCEVVIWRDPRLKGNEVLWPALQSHLKDSAVIVSVVSPRYVESPACQKELEFFHQAAEQSGGFQADNHVRAFKVLKTPVERKDHPRIIQALVPYEFYGPDPETGKEREFYLDPRQGEFKRHLAKIDDLARDIAEELKFLKSKPLPPERRASPDGRIRVYVAETTTDVREQRDRLIRELRAHDYVVLPANSLPTLDGADALRRSIRANLNECKLSVHLVGDRYGTVPEGTDRSVAVLQHELALEHAEAGGSFEVIWMPQSLAATEKSQVEFIAQLKRLSTAHGELVTINIEDLKDYIHDKLRTRPPNLPGPPFIYLIFDPRDQEAIEVIRKELQRCCEVRLPLQGGKASKVREDHEEYLKLCDGAVIYYGQPNDYWFRTKDRDLLKARGLRQKQLKALLYLDAPATQEKEKYESRVNRVCRHFKDCPDCIQPFLDELRHL
jgi:hypothetical protein